MAGAAGSDPLAETDDQSALRQLARDLASREVAPRAHQADESGQLATEGKKTEKAAADAAKNG